MSLTIHLRNQEKLTVNLAKFPYKVMRTDKKDTFDVVLTVHRR